MIPLSKHCPECDSETLFSTSIKSAGGDGHNLLPDLGGFLTFADLTVIVCSSCGLTRFYAESSACEKLPRSSRWKRL